jgi:hypothetical protein
VGWAVGHGANRRGPTRPAQAPSAARGRGNVAGHAAVLVVVWLVCVGYLGLRADRGWIPHDEGLLGQTAERVLAGELPHRDFDDTYTGGLALLHAAAFRVLGVELRSLRLVLLLFCCAFIPVVYWIAARETPPLVAGLVTLVCVAWSVPNYFAGLPSWYNLFFATFGTAALLRHVETGRRRWLFVAGLCGGCAIVVKTIGLYFVAAALLYLLYREQLLQPPRAGDDRARPGGLAAVTVPAVIAFVAATSVLVSLAGGLMAVVQFVVAPAALCGVLAWSELRAGGRGVPARLRELAGTVLPFAAGVALPCALFAAPYVVTGNAGALLHGVFVLPQQRFEFAVFSLPPLWTLLAVLPLALLLFVPLRARAEPTLLAIVAVLFVVAAAFGWEEHVYATMWHSARSAVVAGTLAGAAVLVAAARSATLSVERRLALFVVLASAALVNLVQFPYAFGIYLCYAAPLIVLAIVYVVAASPAASARVHVGILLVYLVFAVAWVNRGFIRDIGGRFTVIEQSTRLDGTRAGLRVSAPEADLYRRLVAVIQAHSADGDFIYATPDCPQVYFLAARRNPTRTFYDFFDADYGADPPRRRDRILALLADRNVDVIVISWQAEFSRTYDPDLVRALVERFPNQVSVGIEERPGPASFTVRWRERP